MEQLTRFAQRLDDPHHNWKINESDYIERGYWDAYMTAYEDAISATSSKHASWFVMSYRQKLVTAGIGKAAYHGGT